MAAAACGNDEAACEGDDCDPSASSASSSSGAGAGTSTGPGPSSSSGAGGSSTGTTSAGGGTGGEGAAGAGGPGGGGTGGAGGGNLGQACSVPGDCNSGFCVDGVCCNGECQGGLCLNCSTGICMTSAGMNPNGICGPTNECQISGACGGQPFSLITFGSSGNDNARAVSTSGFNAAIIGTSDTGIDFGNGALAAGAFVAYFDYQQDNLVHIFSRSLGGADLRDVVTTQNYVTVVGSFTGTVDFGNGSVTSQGGEDMFVASYDRNAGTLTWLETFGGPGPQRATAIDEVGNDHIIVGDYAGALTIGGNALPVASGGNNHVIFKLSSSGTPIWSTAHAVGSASNATGQARIDAHNDDVFVVAEYSGITAWGGQNLDVGALGFAVMRVDEATGALAWVQGFSAPAPHVAGNTNEVILAGVTSTGVDFGGGLLTPTGGDDLFHVELDAMTGAHQNSLMLGGPGDEQVGGVIHRGDTAFGAFEGSADFGGGVLTSQDGVDGLALSYSNGFHQFSATYSGMGTQRITAAHEDGNVALAGDFESTMDFFGDVRTSTGQSDIFIALY